MNDKDHIHTRFYLFLVKIFRLGTEMNILPLVFALFFSGSYVLILFSELFHNVSITEKVSFWICLPVLFARIGMVIKSVCQKTAEFRVFNSQDRNI